MFYVVGDGLVGSIFKDNRDFTVKHRDNRCVGDGIVNAAALSGKAVCDAAGFEETLRANVDLPLQLCELASDANVPYIVFSSASVYAANNRPVHEFDLVYPSNLYVASKLLMESALPANCFIFRIPQVDLGNGHPNDLGEKVKRWRKCEDRFTSLIHADTIYQVVYRALTQEIEPGVYNLASEAVNLFDHIRDKYKWEGEVVPKGSLGLSNIPVLDTTKAKMVNLI